jgi:competence protein ComEC
VFGLFNTTSFFARVPHATINIVRPRLVDIALYYLLLGLAVALLDEDFRRRWRWERALTWLTVGGAVAMVFLTVRPARRELVVTFVDMGQGEAIIVRSPSGRALLIDGGSTDTDGERVARRVLLPSLFAAGVRQLDAILITHPHEDHMNAVPAVLREVPTKLVLTGGQESTDAAMEAIASLCRAKEIPLQSLSRRAALDLGEGVKAYVLFPVQPFIRGTDSDLNNNSVVLKLCYGEISLLLVGDLEIEGEHRLLQRGDDLRSTLLKVGHQGAANACSREFLQAVQPKVAVISVGAMNPFGHPHEQTIHRLKEVGAHIYRTDVHGTITLRTDGTSYTIEPFNM